jgi:hypothetical protein
MGRYFSSQRQKAPRGAFDRTFRNVSTKGNLVVGSTLSATSSVTLGSNSGNTVSVAGTTTFSAAVTLNNNLTVSGNVVFSSTGAMVLPSGTSANRPSTPSAGMLRYNTQVANIEFWNTGTSMWTLVGTGSGSGGAVGGGTDRVFYENDQSVNTAYTISTGKNAVSAGPITINAPVTVPAGSAWAIV